MRRILYSIVITVTLPIFGQAKEPSNEVGDNLFIFGIGFGLVQPNRIVEIPPLSVSYERIISDEIIEKGSIGTGIYLGLSRHSWEIFEGWMGNSTIFISGVRGSFNYQIMDKIDIYAGVMLGLEIVYDRDAAGESFIWSTYSGGRYLLSNYFMLFAELGYGITYLNIGIVLKMP
jgi:hypothetical protein